jgi:hypothetical protein
VNALASPEVGKFVNKYFVSSFQRVGTFKIADNGQKQGGNVATYFCAPDGRVLHVIAGPVDAKTVLEEANWVVRTAQETISKSKGDGTRFKQLLRTAHAERLEENYGVRVTPFMKDQIVQDLATATAYRDAEGRHLAPVLSLPPVENSKDPSTNAAKVHQLLAGHAGRKIEDLYGAVFQSILGEKVTTKPVQTNKLFTWRKESDRP